VVEEDIFDLEAVRNLAMMIDLAVGSDLVREVPGD
jgi:hypothetical protein